MLSDGLSVTVNCNTSSAVQPSFSDLYRPDASYVDPSKSIVSPEHIVSTVMLSVGFCVTTNCRTSLYGHPLESKTGFV